MACPAQTTVLCSLTSISFSGQPSGPTETPRYWPVVIALQADVATAATAMMNRFMGHGLHVSSHETTRIARPMDPAQPKWGTFDGREP